MQGISPVGFEGSGASEIHVYEFDAVDASLQIL